MYHYSPPPNERPNAVFLDDFEPSKKRMIRPRTAEEELEGGGSLSAGDTPPGGKKGESFFEPVSALPPA